MSTSEIRFEVYPVGAEPCRANLIGYVRRVPAGRWICGEAVEDLPGCAQILSACQWAIRQRPKPTQMELDCGVIVIRSEV